MSEPKATPDPDTIPPMSGQRRRQTQRWISAPPTAEPRRTPTKTGLSAPPPPPPQPSASERVLRAVGLGYRPVRAPR
ncbi:MAG: hypothetical protein ABI895_23565 [Deltaproteobacteria bacterium]